MGAGGLWHQWQLTGGGDDCFVMRWTLNLPQRDLPLTFAPLAPGMIHDSMRRRPRDARIVFLSLHKMCEQGRILPRLGNHIFIYFFFIYIFFFALWVSPHLLLLRLWFRDVLWDP